MGSGGYEVSTAPDSTMARRSPRDADGTIRVVEHVDAGYITLVQAAKYLAVSSRTIRRWIGERSLPHYYIGGRQRGKLLFKKGELDRWARRFKGRLAVDCRNSLDAMGPEAL